MTWIKGVMMVLINLCVQLGVFDAFPPGDTASAAEIAAKVDVDVSIICTPLPSPDTYPELTPPQRASSAPSSSKASSPPPLPTSPPATRTPPRPWPSTAPTATTSGARPSRSPSTATGRTGPTTSARTRSPRRRTRCAARSRGRRATRGLGSLPLSSRIKCTRRFGSGRWRCGQSTSRWWWARACFRGRR